MQRLTLGGNNWLTLSVEQMVASMQISIESAQNISNQNVCCFMVDRPAPAIPDVVSYFSLEEVVNDYAKETGSWIKLKSTPSVFIVGKCDDAFSTVTKKVIINVDLTATAIFHDVMVKRSFSVEKMKLHRLLKIIDDLHVCTGITDYQDVSVAGSYMFVSTEIHSGRPVKKTVTRSKACEGTVEGGSICAPCSSLTPALQERYQQVPHNNTPLSLMNRNQLITVVKQNRTDIMRYKQKLTTETTHVSPNLSEGLAASLDMHIETTTPFMKLFWEEQKKALSMDARGMRWHPMMVRFSIYLHYQSPRAYEALRETGVLRLPNKSTLRDYTNSVAPSVGFCTEAFKDLRRQAEDLPAERRYVALLHDEMKIKADLVYDRRSDQVIGFVNPESWTFSDGSEELIATHVLVFMVVGITSHIKMSIGHFPASTATAGDLFPLLWKAIAYLEISCGLKVISSTSDKASPNQRLYRLHKLGGEPVVYKAANPFAQESRDVFFISDAPHLLKTIRNNVEKSKSGGTRYLWNNGHYILWDHVRKVYNDDLNRELYRTKLTVDHVYLTSSNRMSVRLAVQVLSDSVSTVMTQYYSPEMSETALLFKLCDRLFDCLNVRSLREYITKRKPDLAPYTSSDDSRFQFLEEDCLEYFEKWHEATVTRTGFSRSERTKMFLSSQTYEGLVMTVRAFTEVTRFLLTNGVPYVLSQDFCQDPLEENFGRHRGLARRSDNPTLHQFGYQANQLRLQRQLAFEFQPKGNTAGRRGERRAISVSNSPLKKIKRH